MPLGLAVHVEHNLLAGHGSGLALGVHHRRLPIVLAAHGYTALHAVLLALLCAGEVPVVVHARGHRHIGLFHVRFKLLEQRVAQTGQMRHAMLAVPVFRGHIVAYLGGFLIAHPLVIVLKYITVEFTALRFALGYRRHRHFGVRLLVGHTTRLYARLTPRVLSDTAAWSSRYSIRWCR